VTGEFAAGIKKGLEQAAGFLERGAWIHYLPSGRSRHQPKPQPPLSGSTTQLRGKLESSVETSHVQATIDIDTM
jgi:hypothetical protein